MKIFSKVFCFIVGILGIVAGILMAFNSIIQKETVLVVFAAGVAFFMLGITLVYRGDKFPRAIKWLRRILVVGISIVTILYFVITCLMVFDVHNYKNTYHDQTVIILGCKANKGVPSVLLKERLDSAVAFLKAHP